MTQPDVPEAGYYRARLVKSGPYVPISISYTASQEDRSPMWVVTRDGEFVDVFDVWPGCSGQPITEAEFNYLTASREHDKRYGHADARKPIDLNSRPTIF